MIQFNLLPDIKQEYLKAQRQKHVVVFISTVAAIACISLFVIMILVVDVWQKKSISDLNKDIKSDTSQITKTPNLNKILTVQNQLNTLTSLHDQKAVATRLFGYVTQITPASASISKLDVDFTQNTVSITGTADSINTVNTYVDTLKFTTYSVSGQKGSPNAFTNVVLSQFARTDSNATYTITASFPAAIFSEAGDTSLTVPKKTTTRSVIDQPTDLFTTNPSKQ